MRPRSKSGSCRSPWPRGHADAIDAKIFYGEIVVLVGDNWAESTVAGCISEIIPSGREALLAARSSDMPDAESAQPWTIEPAYQGCGSLRTSWSAL